MSGLHFHFQKKSKKVSKDILWSSNPFTKKIVMVQMNAIHCVYSHFFVQTKV